jgi:hypothetical protein
MGHAERSLQIGVTGRLPREGWREHDLSTDHRHRWDRLETVHWFTCDRCPLKANVVTVDARLTG